MNTVSDTLTVTFDNSLDDETGICVSRVVNGKITILKMELGEQADILYQLLTEQMTKAEIKTEDGEINNKNLCDSCINNDCIFQSGIFRNHCDFYKAESENG